MVRHEWKRTRVGMGELGPGLRLHRHSLSSPPNPPLHRGLSSPLSPQQKVMSESTAPLPHINESRALMTGKQLAEEPIFAAAPSE